MSTDTLRNVTVNDELTAAVNAALDPADIRAAILAQAAKQQEESDASVAALSVKEKEAADKAAKEQAELDSAKQFTRTEVIGGREFSFEAASELELERMVTNAYKIAFAIQPTETPKAPVVDPAIAAAEAQKAAEQQAADRAELELKFKRGDISAADYIEQSGAVKDYLAKEGLSVTDLKAAVNKTVADQEAQSWSADVEQFLNSPAGSDWPGGEQNKKLIGLQIAALGLVDATDKVAALAQAYQSMKTDGIVFQPEKPAVTPTATATPAATVAPVVAATPVAPAAPAPAPRTPSTSSSVFGASSGTQGTSAPAPTTNAQQEAIKIAQNATPEEIMDAWKKAQVASGKNPDDAFREAYSARRV